MKSTGQREICSTAYRKETGNIWGFDFAPMPDAQFMSNFDWRVRDETGNVIYEFEAYMIRTLKGPNGPFLNMRFRDRAWRAAPDNAKLVAELHSPAA
jgi:hypothetical protein